MAIVEQGGNYIGELQGNRNNKIYVCACVYAYIYTYMCGGERETEGVLIDLRNWLT